MLVNNVTADLPPYPMEELNRIKKELKKTGKTIYDFGTGDPKIPTWPGIIDALKSAIPKISQYPSVSGLDRLEDAHKNYLRRRFNIAIDDKIRICPTQGSKEAIFHVHLSLINRSPNKNVIIYPNPGYPVYRSGTLFAGGTPYPVSIEKKNNYLIEPWQLPLTIQNQACAIWINYPHNPTSALADRQYYTELINWAHKFDCIILSDDCYVDIYDVEFDQQLLKNQKKDPRPITPLMLTADRVIAFFSLSKRSGMTGYRCGFMAGDANIVNPILKARANFGVGVPDCIQEAAIIAWDDDQHVYERRKIFTERIKLSAPVLQKLGLLSYVPKATFYLWTKIPSHYKDDVQFCLDLAKSGIITIPSSWLSENIKGYLRFSLVPDKEETQQAFEILKTFVKN